MLNVESIFFVFTIFVESIFFEKTILKEISIIKQEADKGATDLHFY